MVNGLYLCFFQVPTYRTAKSRENILRKPSVYVDDIEEASVVNNLIFKYIFPPPSIRSLATKFTKDVLNKNGEVYMAVHWRYDKEVGIIVILL